jgi:hypothetical protein
MPIAASLSWIRGAAHHVGSDNLPAPGAEIDTIPVGRPQSKKLAKVVLEIVNLPGVEPVVNLRVNVTQLRTGLWRLEAYLRWHFWKGRIES